MKAYAYIMTHSGYPTVFYKDYESSFKEELKNLILIQRTIASGSEDILVVDQDEYIMRRNGVGNNPGLVLYINTSNQIKEKTISTNWKSKTLYDYSSHINEIATTDANGDATLKAPANSYSIWSIN